jgi:DNA-binding CsgD family transcriptional regulator
MPMSSDLERIPFMVIFHFVFNKQLQIIDTCDEGAKIAKNWFGTDRWLNDWSICELSSQPARNRVRTIEPMLRKTLKNKTLQINKTLFGYDNVWYETSRYFAPTDTGGVIMKSIVTDTSTIYNGHFDNLDPPTKRLVLSPNLTLSHRELKVLHYYASGISAKRTAPKLFVTKKAVEATLFRVKEKLRYYDQPELSLLENLKQRDLIPFLIAQEDWFNYIKNNTE